MPPLPKKKTSRARQGERRSHLHMALIAMVECPHCHKPRQPHRACPNCGYYKGMEIGPVRPTKSS